jgi:hypothetical protein
MTRLILSLLLALAPVNCYAVTAAKEPPPSTEFGRDWHNSEDAEAAAALLPGVGFDALPDGTVIGGAAGASLTLRPGATGIGTLTIAGIDTDTGLVGASYLRVQSGGTPTLSLVGPTISGANLNGTLGSTTPSTVSATTVVASGNITGFGTITAVGGFVGAVPVASLNGGTGASNSTFWRGDGTWATPAGGLASADIDTSAELRTILTDEVGTGAAYFVGGALGTPASGTVTNLTGTASININGTVGATTPTTGAFTTVTASTPITDANVANALTIDGGTINNSAIGGGTPSTGIFTTLQTTSTITSLATVTIAPAANTSALVSTGYSLTGSNAQSLIDLAGTWNTSGTPTLIKASVTDTASNAASKMLELIVGGSTVFQVGKTGNATAVGTLGHVSGFETYNTTAAALARTVSQRENAIYSGAAAGLYMASDNVIEWTSGNGGGSDGANTGNSDTGLARAAAGVIAVTNGSTGGGAMQFTEMTSPSAPATNNIVFFAEDNGSGKTRLMARFPTGATQQVAIEP